MKLRLLTLFCVASSAALGQLATPNSTGIAMGHIDLNVHDPDVSRQFYLSLGGMAVRNGTLDMVEFPGVYIVLTKQDPTGGSVGTAVDHFGFLVVSIDDSLAKWKGLGYQIDAGSHPTQNYLTSPDGARIEIYEDKTIATPMKFHHVHFYLPDAPGAQTWYAKEFGAIPGKRLNFDAADIPGANLTFSKSDATRISTKGRAVDHIGFEVTNLAAFAKKLEADGVKLDQVPGLASNGTTKVAFLYDPWGTYIELTEGLAPTAK